MQEDQRPKHVGDRCLPRYNTDHQARGRGLAKTFRFSTILRKSLDGMRFWAPSDAVDDRLAHTVHTCTRLSGTLCGPRRRAPEGRTPSWYVCIFCFAFH